MALGRNPWHQASHKSLGVVHRRLGDTVAAERHERLASIIAF
jgi:hypothetical protein